MTNLLTTAEYQLAAISLAGQVADSHAAQGVFHDYASRKALNTIKAQAADLTVWADYLAAAGIPEVPGAAVLQSEPNAWTGVSWGLVKGFVQWQLANHHAVASINRRLSTVKTYAKLAMQAGAIDTQQYALIATVTGYSDKEVSRINGGRLVTRRGHKKAATVVIDAEQAKELKSQPDTPQGRRDALLMCLLLDHGLRVGEVVLLQVGDFDLRAGTVVFTRPKVSKEQKHKLSADTLRVLRSWIDAGDCAPFGPLLRGSNKSGKLTEAGISERAIQGRVKALGERVGLTVLSPHDCRHYWATSWAGKVDLFRLQEAGGWNSLTMPRRYVKRAEVANEGMA